MLAITDAQIGAWVGGLLWPLFRIAALLMTMPVIGTRLLPMRLRLYLALAITVAIAPVLPAPPSVDALSLSGMLLAAEQVLIGVGLGFSLQLFFHAFIMAGQIIATQMGLGFASMMDPMNGISVPVLGQFYLMLVSLLFLSMNGHLVTFEILVESFNTLPIGQSLSAQHEWQLVGRLGWVLAAGLLLTLPVITALLVINIAFGVMTRAAPQLNIFAIGFPLTLVLGLIIAWIGLQDVEDQFQALLHEALIFLRDLSGAR